MLPQEEAFVHIAIPSPLKDFLIYRVPGHLRATIKPGVRVLVPLGKRTVTGIVFELLAHTALAKTKEIIAILDEHPILDGQLLRLSEWVGRYYLAPVGDVLGTILPSSVRAESLSMVIALPGTFSARTKLEEQILTLLREKKGKIGVKTLTRAIAAGSVYHALQQLEMRGAIELRKRLPGQRGTCNPTIAESNPDSSVPQTRFALNSQQEHAWQAIDHRLRKGGFETFLLHGATGSGKTEVYLRAMERAREMGRRSIILIPEISLTPQLLDRVHSRFPGSVGILHSGLTTAERRSHWWQIVRGEVDVVVGARSAVFAPLPDLGLIIVDEEHDTSYKQEEGVKYNGRDVAVVRGKSLGCPVILGSATPALESYENCRQGRYRLLEITQRVHKRPLPRIETVDLRSQFKPSKASHVTAGPRNRRRSKSDHQWISMEFAEALKRNFEESRQTLIFLNRRGFANFLQCTLCGHILRCPYCSVTLTLHRKQKIVSCHHCNFRVPETERCPRCGNQTLSGVGAGTEQIEQALHQMMPEARIARMDRDTMSKRGAHEELLGRWERGDIDILVGTQMITKGHDVSGVTLVGALLADLSLNLPDFRAAERTFQVLSQVAGRSGRGEVPGRVIIQTYAPDHYAIQHLTRHDYKGFFAAEIEHRLALNYPPFCRLVNLRIDGAKADEVEARARAFAADLRDMQRCDARLREQIEILGPAPAPIEKIRNRYRWQILLKGKLSSSLLDFTKQARDRFPQSRRARVHIDVDPYNML